MPEDYDCWYQYVIVRKDMPRVYHIVQACHAVQEATIKFGGPTVPLPIHLILLQVDSEAQLKDAEWMLSARGVKSIIFHEPDYDTGLTALAAELIKRDEPRRDAFKLFRMYK